MKLNIFKGFKGLYQKRIKPQTLYAVNAGLYMGQFFLFLNHLSKDGKYDVLSMPDMIPMTINEKDVTEGLEKGIIERVDKIPNELFALCIAEHNHRLKLKEKEENDKLSDRREQLTSSGALDQSDEDLQDEFELGLR